MIAKWVSLGVVLIGLLLVGAPVNAKSLVPVNQLECGETFPCSTDLQRRVDFWIQVFSEWARDDIILHDSQLPWQVYEVISGYESCGARKVKKQRKRLAANLNALAERLKKGLPAKGKTQQRLASHFKPLRYKAVRAAAKNLRCQIGVKDQFKNALARYARYSPMVTGIIVDMRMSPEFQYLPFVESSFRPDAYSKAGAAGMWQIMPATARTLGMQINATIDERLDPAASTRGAMRYFKEAISKLTKAAREKKPNVTDAELAPFIITSYNYGINGMRRAIQALGPDFDKVLREYKSASFRVAVKNFYASFLAARHLTKNVEKYFDNIERLPALNVTTLVLNHPTSIERIKNTFALTEAQLRPYNPALTRFVWHNWRLIPAGYRLVLPPPSGAWAQQITALRALPPEDELTTNVVYRVRKGDTACAVARAFKVRCKDLLDVNRLGKKGRIRIGQRLDIPGKYRRTSASVNTKAKASVGKSTSAKKKTVPATSKDGRYQVRKGDTACKIAERFSVPCRQLIRHNRLGRSAKIKVGQSLTIPGLTRSRKARVAQSGAQTQAYTVRKGDSACQIAESFDVPCKRLIKANRLGKTARIRVGQKLKIPGTETQQAAVVAPHVDEKAVQNLVSTLDEVPALVLEQSKSGGKPRYHVTVAPEETLGHYADWLQTGSSRAISALNKLKHKQLIKPGQRLRLPIKNEVEAQHFKDNRNEYHQVLLEQLKENFELTGQRDIQIKSGDNLWQLARDHNAPLWLLYRMNPDLSEDLRLGQTLIVPTLKRK